MGLPTTRDQTFGALTKVNSTTLNNIQDTIVSLYAGWRLARGDGHPTVEASPWAWGGSLRDWFVSATGKTLVWALPGLIAGQTLKAVRLRLYQAGNTDRVSVQVRKHSYIDGAVSDLSAVVNSAAAASFQLLDVPLTAPELISAGQCVDLDIVSIDAGVGERHVCQVEYQLG